jgi:hypothetical protein
MMSFRAGVGIDLPYHARRDDTPETANRRGHDPRSRVGLALLPLLAAAHDYFEAAAFVVRAAGMKGAARLRRSRSRARQRIDTPIPWRAASCAARLYSLRHQRPADPARARRPRAGIAEPRLINFATEIAATGHRSSPRNFPISRSTRSPRARPT